MRRFQEKYAKKGSNKGPFFRLAVAASLFVLLGNTLSAASADDTPPQGGTTPPPPSSITTTTTVTTMAVTTSKTEGTPPPPDLTNGALCGRVTEAGTGKPVGYATVALQDKDGNMIAWTRTDAEGRYILPAETMKVLQLQPSRRRGLLERIVVATGNVIAAPVKLVGDAMKMGPVDAAKTAFAAVAGGGVGLAGAVAGRVQGAAFGKVQAAALRDVPGERTAVPKAQRTTLVPGEVYMLVSAPHYKEIRGRAGAWWIDPPQGTDKKDDKPDNVTVGPFAHLETVVLAPTGGDQASDIQEAAVLLRNLKADKTLVPAGTAVHLHVRLEVPEAGKLPVRIFAREEAKGTVAELTPQPEGNNIYAGDLVIPADTPSSDTTITVIALRAQPVEVNIKHDDKFDPLKEFAAELDEMHPDKPFEFDPRLFAAENRLELAITVLGEKEKR